MCNLGQIVSQPLPRRRSSLLHSNFQSRESPFEIIPSTLHRHLERGRIGLSEALSAEVEHVLVEALTEQLGKPHEEIMDYIELIFTDDEWRQLAKPSLERDH